MPFDFNYDESYNLIYEKVTGVETDQSFLEYLAKIREYPHFKPGVKILRDLTDAKIETSSEGVWKGKDIAIENAEGFSAATWAAVMPSDVGYGLGVMFETLVQETDMELQIFRDLESAKQWLGLPRDYQPGQQNP